MVYCPLHVSPPNLLIVNPSLLRSTKFLPFSVLKPAISYLQAFILPLQQQQPETMCFQVRTFVCLFIPFSGRWYVGLQWGNFITFCTNVHLDLRENKSDHGQRSPWPQSKFWTNFMNLNGGCYKLSHRRWWQFISERLKVNFIHYILHNTDFWGFDLIP